MMYRIMTFLLASLLLISISAPSYAALFNDDGSLAETQAGSSGGGCNWDEFLEKLGQQETGFVCGGGGPCDKQYTTVSPRANDPSWGKWQFTPDKWAEMTAVEYPQCQGQANAISVECRPAQKWAAQKNMEAAVKWMKEHNWCDGKLGMSVTGTHQGTTKSCTVTKSGLLSAYHNAQGNACAFTGGTSKWSSQINWRVCDAGNIPFPENCTPDPSKPYVPPTVTPGTPTPYPPGMGFEHLGHFDNLSESLKYIWVAAFKIMTSQLTTTMIQQVEVIGSFFDAKHQLETQRLMQQKYAQAHKDYHPSEQMCEIGTFVRNLADTEERAKLTQIAMSRAMIDRELINGDVQTMTGGADEATRLRQYLDTFCNVDDNAKLNKELCEKSGKPDQQNADINFTKTIDAPLTLDVNLLDNDVKDDEENLFAFLDYIFMNDSLPWLKDSRTVLHNFVKPYQDMRSLIAMRSVAQNSFAHIIAEKTAGPENADESVAPFIKALLDEMGMDPKDIEETIGKNPSYYAQMEMLTKKIYQNPEFVSNLYDKPANVKRIRAAMTAIKLMQDRDIHDALLRREMLMSMLLELKLRYRQQNMENKDLNSINSNPPGPSIEGTGGASTGQNNSF